MGTGFSVPCSLVYLLKSVEVMRMIWQVVFEYRSSSVSSNDIQKSLAVHKGHEYLISRYSQGICRTLTETEIVVKGNLIQSYQ